MTTTTQNRILPATAAIVGYTILIGFTDNFVRVIAVDTGLWQFHLIRSIMAVPLIALAALVLGLRLRPKRPLALAARSAVQATGIMIYFGCLGFLSVAQAAAGLFTAPIFVLLITRFAYGYPLGPVRIAAVALGFVGVLLVLQPGVQTQLSWVSAVPVLAGAFYALGNIATREWCAEETAEAMTLGFFIALGLGGLIGVIALAFWDPAVPPGMDGFILRGWVMPSSTFFYWTIVQAVGSILGIGLMIKGYQLAEASRVSIIEYIILPVSAGWSFLLWGESLAPSAFLGLGLIFIAGVLIAFRK